MSTTLFEEKLLGWVTAKVEYFVVLCQYISCYTKQ